MNVCGSNKIKILKEHEFVRDVRDGKREGRNMKKIQGRETRGRRILV